jgi:NTP pyrophosphatase (non-canonical NTP hydrolase)
MDIKALQRALQEFADARAWDQFHNPKNLAMALSVEAGEVVEIFQWLSEDAAARVADNEELKQRVAEELADVALYLVRLADKTGIDLDASIQAKLIKNGEKYPPDQVYGSAKKYTEY